MLLHFEIFYILGFTRKWHKNGYEQELDSHSHFGYSLEATTRQVLFTANSRICLDLVFGAPGAVAGTEADLQMAPVLCSCSARVI